MRAHFSLLTQRVDLRKNLDFFRICLHAMTEIASYAHFLCASDAKNLKEIYKIFQWNCIIFYGKMAKMAQIAHTAKRPARNGSSIQPG